jgi:nitric oxide reductase NorD protein
VAKESVAVMCDALELLGDRHAVYGFSGEGRHRVDIHVAKEFDDRTSPATWAALSEMRALKYTRMGPAVRHATAKLVAQPSRTKLLIVISDGYPQDIDYGPIRGDREYGLQDTARALRDAVDAGIAPYLLTIDPAGHEYLRRMLPPQSYVVIEDVDSLPRELAALYGNVAFASSRGW